MGNNEMMAMANAREIEKLPYDTLKALFPNVRYMVQGERWYRKFIGHRTNEITGKEETYAAGEWKAEINGREFDTPQMAYEYARMNYSKGHFKVYAFVPELHRVSNQIINE
jgi:hypothetical protein